MLTLSILPKCAWHTCHNTTFITKFGKPAKYCSPQCKNKYGVDLKRRRLKLKAVAYLGGKCIDCGYNRCVASLHFDHRADKSFSISKNGYTRSWERVRKELDKCDLRCANCHGERHYEEDLLTRQDSNL